MTIKVNETFSGIQGEGLTTGLPVYFVRLAGCNLNCDFCDTKYHKVKSLDTMHTVLNKIRNSGIDDIVFTGGEPMLQINEINKLKHYLPHHTFHLETNGTIYDKRIDQFRFISCSPKKQAVIDKNSDELDSYKKINGQVLSSFKFVMKIKMMIGGLIL